MRKDISFLLRDHRFAGTHTNEYDVEVFCKKEPWEMSYKDFFDEFERLMASVGRKESKGHLDPNRAPYQPLTYTEKALIRKNWKKFSRIRGFSDDDIAEYERWLVLSGRRDQLPGAIPYPWRRVQHITLPPILYRQHIERALREKRKLHPRVLFDYYMIVKSEGASTQQHLHTVPVH